MGYGLWLVLWWPFLVSFSQLFRLVREIDFLDLFVSFKKQPLGMLQTLKD